MTTINGYVHPDFAAVKQAFTVNFDQYNEVGAACAVYYKGQCVVDLWGGYRDAQQTLPWQQETIQLVFSTAKGMTATCINLLAERGKLDLDAPIATYWPEFAANNKQHITTRMVLSHQAGLAAVDGELTLPEVLSWHPVVEAIAAQSPNWEPGSGHGYHARSFGWILGEVVRRIEGISIGTFLQKEICRPLALDLWIGLPEDELSRCATVIPPEPGGKTIEDILGADSLTARVMSGPSGLFGYNQMWNEPALLQAEMPSSNAVASARSLAKFYAALIGKVDGIQLLKAETLQAAIAEQSSGIDKVVMSESRFGSGFALPPFLASGCGANSFGHPGAGGSLGFADPDADISFAYVMNHMRFDPTGDPRSDGLIEALYQAL